MQFTHLLLFSCLLCVSVCSDRDTINKIEEFKKYFNDYKNQTSSNADKTLFHILRKHVDVCPCAYNYLKKIQESFGKQNSTEVLMMKDILKSLMDKVPKISKNCHTKRVTTSQTNNFETFFQHFLSKNCINQSKQKTG